VLCCACVCNVCVCVCVCACWSLCKCVCVCCVYVYVCLCLVVMETLVSTALRLPVWSNISQEIQLRLFQHTLTETCTRVPCAIDMYNLRKTVGCSLE